jgi:hypothetical protein
MEFIDDALRRLGIYGGMRLLLARFDRDCGWLATRMATVSSMHLLPGFQRLKGYLPTALDGSPRTLARRRDAENAQRINKVRR